MFGLASGSSFSPADLALCPLQRKVGRNLPALPQSGPACEDLDLAPSRRTDRADIAPSRLPRANSTPALQGDGIRARLGVPAGPFRRHGPRRAGGGPESFFAPPWSRSTGVSVINVPRSVL